MIGRAACLAILLVLAGCYVADEPPEPQAGAPEPAPLSYDYLTKLNLDVGEIVVDDTWTPLADSGNHVEEVATPRPIEALSRMVHDRLVATGTSGRAMVTIEDASLVRTPGQIVGTFVVRVAPQDGSSAPLPVNAAVSGTRTLSSDDSERATADTLVKQLMDRMNVELEYQIRNQTKDQATSGTAPVPAPVRTEDLAPPATP